MNKDSINERIEKLRARMAAHGIQACIIPSTDSHQSEYVADHWKGREWVSGFSGSAGIAVITAKHAGLWTDSRYFLQAEAELANSEFELMRQGASPTANHIHWLCQNLPKGAQVAIGGRLASQKQAQNQGSKLKKKGLQLVTDKDLLDEAWTDRPPLPKQPVYDYPVQFAGQSRSEKIAALRLQMGKYPACSHYLVSALDEIAWLFNLRGSDVEFNPVFYAFALIGKGESMLFLEKEQLTEELKSSLESDGISLQPYGNLDLALQEMSKSSRILAADDGSSVHLVHQLRQGSFHWIKSILTDLKGVKNPIEVGHLRKTMEKDGVALLRLYRWLEQRLPQGGLRESEVASHLARLRSEQANYIGESFPAIAGYGSNGAIVHYRPEPGKDAELKAEGLFLLDSGGQYLDGTTDITRTVALGKPTEQQKRHFTLVLKGHIALASFRFPKGTSGNQIDALARMHLWAEGLDYGHGTGHGVGFFLNVHEGPQRIAGGTGAALVPLKPGMITSNEPGFYLDGEYGIRIENLVLTVEDRVTDFGTFYKFEDLSLFHMDMNLIQSEMLTQKEKDWLNKYQKTVYERLAPFLEFEEKAWLAEKCGKL